MIHLIKSIDNQFYFTVTAKNGRVLATSETYRAKRSAIGAIDSMARRFGTSLAKTGYTDHTKMKRL